MLFFGSLKIIVLNDHFCDDAQRFDGHGNASESKERLFIKKKIFYFLTSLKPTF
jgi:hypothetical protein